MKLSIIVKCPYGECHFSHLLIVLLSVIKLSAIMLNVIILIVVAPSSLSCLIKITEEKTFITLTTCLCLNEKCLRLLVDLVKDFRYSNF